MDIARHEVSRNDMTRIRLPSATTFGAGGSSPFFLFQFFSGRKKWWRRYPGGKLNARQVATSLISLDYRLIGKALVRKDAVPP